MHFDSDEERWFSWWLDELKEAGIIKDYKRAETYVLSNPLEVTYFVASPTKKEPNRTKSKTSALLRGHEYTAEFEINLNYLDNRLEQFFCMKGQWKGLKDVRLVSSYIENPARHAVIIEVKPAFDQNNMTRAFIINQKWMMEKYGIMVNLVKPLALFEKTFTPKRFMLTEKTLKPRTIHFKTRTLNEFLNEST